MNRFRQDRLHAAALLLGLLVVFALIVLGAMVVTRNEPHARAAAQLRQDLRAQEAFAAESRR